MVFSWLCFYSLGSIIWNLQHCHRQKGKVSVWISECVRIYCSLFSILLPSWVNRCLLSSRHKKKERWERLFAALSENLNTGLVQFKIHNMIWLLFILIFLTEKTVLRNMKDHSLVLKSDNLQYNTLVCCADATNNSLTKRLTFQVFFFMIFYRL